MSAGHAAVYSSMGLALVPIARGTKKPLKGVTGWQKTPVRDPDEALRLWTAGGAYQGTGLACVNEHSNTFVLDIDDVDAARAALAAVGLNLDALLAAGVQSKSPKTERRKAWFSRPAEVAPDVLAVIWRDADGAPKKIIELRTAGYDVLPPTPYPADSERGIPGGYFYEWIGPDPIAFPAMPLALVALLGDWPAMLAKMQAADPNAAPRVEASPRPTPQGPGRAVGGGATWDTARAEIRKRLSPSDGLELDAKGRCKCPLHPGDSANSFAVFTGNDGIERWRCFHGALDHGLVAEDHLSTAGDVVDLYALTHGLSIGKATATLARQLGIPLPERPGPDIDMDEFIRATKDRTNTNGSAHHDGPRVDPPPRDDATGHGGPIQYADRPADETLPARQREAIANAKPAGDTLVLICLADVEPRPVRWLWRDKIPLDATTSVFGVPGAGKGTATIDIAARVTRGRPMPDGAPSDIEGPARVLIFSSEEGAADTILPRLIAAGGDPSKVLILESVSRLGRNGKRKRGALDFAEDFDLIATTIAGYPDLRLVVIDPLDAYIGNVDSHKNAAMRSMVLAPLSELAQKHGLAIVVVGHPRKGREGSALDSLSGSAATAAACRIVWQFVPDGEVEGRTKMLFVKGNLSPNRSGLAFNFVSVDVPTPSGVANVGAVEWEPGAIDETADEAQAAAHAAVHAAAAEARRASRAAPRETGAKPAHLSAVDTTMARYLTILADGAWHPRATVLAADPDATDATSRRARERLGIETRQLRGDDGRRLDADWRLTACSPSPGPEGATGGPEKVEHPVNGLAGHDSGACTFSPRSPPPVAPPNEHPVETDADEHAVDIQHDAPAEVDADGYELGP